MSYRQFMIALCISLLAICAPGAFGQSSTPLNVTDVAVQNQVTVNTCSAGEPVALNGDVNVQYSVGTDPNTGANLFFVTASNNLTGVGQTTGSQYAAADSGDYTFSSNQTSTEATVQLKADLTPQSTGTAMTLVQQLQISVDTVGDLTVQLLGNTSSCGGN